MTKILDCPFCGSNAHTKKLAGGFKGAGCQNNVDCGAMMIGKVTKGTIIDRWNRRYTPLNEWVKEGECEEHNTSWDNGEGCTECITKLKQKGA